MPLTPLQPAVQRKIIKASSIGQASKTNQFSFVLQEICDLPCFGTVARANPRKES